MNIKPIASNQTELTTTAGTVILFSYQTPVAALKIGHNTIQLNTINAPSGALEGNIVSTLTSLNIHDIVDIDIKTDVLNTKNNQFTVSKYYFRDSEGNVFTVNAFLKEEQDK